MARPDVLYLVHRLPYPPDKGDRIRTFHVLEWLSRRAAVHLACLADEPVEECRLSDVRLADDGDKSGSCHIQTRTRRRAEGVKRRLFDRRGSRSTTKGFGVFTGSFCLDFLFWCLGAPPRNSARLRVQSVLLYLRKSKIGEIPNVNSS